MTEQPTIASPVDTERYGSFSCPGAVLADGAQPASRGAATVAAA